MAAAECDRTANTDVAHGWNGSSATFPADVSQPDAAPPRQGRRPVATSAAKRNSWTEAHPLLPPRRGGGTLPLPKSAIRPNAPGERGALSPPII